MSGLQEARPDELFPTKGAIPEALQIGRDASWHDIAGRVVDGDDVIVIQPRKIGKTSTIKNGALPRVHEQFAGVVAQVDLAAAGLRDDPLGLAAALQRTAMATGADRAVAPQALRRIAQATKRFVHGDRARAAAELAGESALAKTAQGVATVLVGAEDPIGALRATLEALEGDAQRYGRPVVVFIDEIQQLGDARRWPQHGRAVQEELARAMRVEGRLMSFAFSGSEQHAMELIFAAGEPLHHEGERYVLPEIADPDWLSEIAARFAQDGRTITEAQILAVLEDSERHPGHTMHTCKALLRLARKVDAAAISDAMVAQAIDETRQNPSARS